MKKKLSEKEIENAKVKSENQGKLLQYEEIVQRLKKQLIEIAQQTQQKKVENQLQHES
jgi:hypothetical protein